jgi:hypothetical protein
VGKEKLLISGLLTHLQDQGKLKVYQFNGNEIEDIISEINKVKPDAILMDDSFTSEIVEIFFHIPDDQKFHLIIINSKENKIQIFDTQKIEIHTMEDFINAL